MEKPKLKKSKTLSINIHDIVKSFHNIYEEENSWYGISLE
jgi:hypothetical protein